MLTTTIPDTTPAAASDRPATIPQVLLSAAGTIQACGLWRGANRGISVVAAISQSARGFDPDVMSLRAIADWEDRTNQGTVVAALIAASKLFGGAA